MGVLSILKPNFLGLMKLLKSMNLLLVFLSLVNISQCIYEDQIGKFDWRQNYVGRIKFAQFDTSSAAKRIIVATEENVLAALNIKTGVIMWRHVFGSGADGTIQMLAITQPSVQDSTSHALVVVGSNPYLVRGFDISDGVLSFEWNLVLKNSQQDMLSEFFWHGQHLVHLLPVPGSHLEVTKYTLTGSPIGTTSKLSAHWVNEGCVLTAPYYVCSSGQTVLALDVTADVMHIIDSPLSTFVDSVEGVLRTLDGHIPVPAFIIDEHRVVLIVDNAFKPVSTKVAQWTASVTIVDTPDGMMLLQAADTGKGVSLSANLLLSGVPLPELSSQDIAPSSGEILAVSCTRSTKGATVCRLLLSGVDDAHNFIMHTGRVIWTREEALAHVVGVEFVDLPVSELEAAIESEFDQKEGSIWSAFTRRLHTQLQQLKSLSFGDHTTEDSTLQRDYFNLHKMLILTTDVGKIFGMDNLSGEIIWSRYDPQLNTERAQIYTRRSARHPPYDALVTIVGSHHETGNGYVISLNPIRGTLVEELHLDVPLLHSAILHKADQEKIHALVLLDTSEAVQVLPQSASSLVEDVFMYVANKETAQVQGYALAYDGKSVKALKTWKLNLGGEPLKSGHKIVLALGKSPHERVHSAGKVLGDRSVLYKYTNPNLVLFVTEAADPVHNSIVVATCVDTVSGAIVASQAHRRATALPLGVHSEHSMAYLYYSEKNRRTEIATMELYEGKSRWLPPGTPFSSYYVTQPPLVERAAYILGANPTAAAFTQTERSLADRHVMLALASGAIIEMPWAYLDPRRPVAPSMEEREEGLIPYSPELPLPSEAVVSYNLTLHRIRALHAAPSGLESTSLVLATGLDLFYTRVAPSKTFDLLKDDFDYHLIILVLTALIVSTYVSKHFASRKMLKMAWK